MAASPAPLGSSGMALSFLTISAQRSAAARPNTTRSISELEPSRLAPCTETQAASPSATSPRTGAAGGPALGAVAGADATPLPDLDGDGAGDHVARGEVLG